MSGVRFAHVNLIARDWEKLAAFYCDLFSCTIVPPKRDYAHEWLATATGLPGARLRGAHLRLPGHGDKGPTLEIFQYDDLDERSPGTPNTVGFRHIAFIVDDLPAMAAQIVARGGSTVGPPVETTIAGQGDLLWQYVRDPEGNMIELQSWE